MFKVGDNIVYPMHGAGTIESIEEREILGEKQKYYIMKMPVGDIQVMVPTKNAELIGVRDVIGSDVAQDVLDVLSQGPTDMSSNWNKRYRDNQDKMKSGDICEVNARGTISDERVSRSSGYAEGFRGRRARLEGSRGDGPPRYGSHPRISGQDLCDVRHAF